MTLLAAHLRHAIHQLGESFEDDRTIHPNIVAVERNVRLLELGLTGLIKIRLLSQGWKARPFDKLRAGSEGS
jgi:hypothetical protein